MLQCQLLATNPIQNAWNPLAGPTLRFNYSAWSLAFAGMSIAFDVLVLCFPFPVVRTLQMTWTRKLQVIATFWLGIFCCIASAVRFYFLYQSINESTSETGPERYLASSTAFIWGTVEPNASIIAACLPCYAPFFAKGQGLSTLLANFGSLFSSRRGSKAKGKPSSDDSLPLDSLLESSSIYPAEAKGRPWVRIEGHNSSQDVDLEGADRWKDRQVASKQSQPFHVKVTRDFTRTETQRS